MRPSMGPSLRAAADAGALGVAISIRGSAEADLDRICERSAELASLADAPSERGDVASENGRSDGSGMSLLLLDFGRKGFADAIITFDGAGAEAPSRNVASSIASSLPSIGARPTYSTLTRARPWP